MSNLVSIIPMAVLMSFGHCLGMCGGFVIAYNTKLTKKTKFKAFIYAFSYHLNRVLAYVMLGILGGFFGSFFKFSQKSLGFLHFFIGILLVIFGIALLKRGALLKFIENDKIWSKFLAKPSKFAMKSENLSGFCLLGFLNGLLPCGVVYTALAMAIMSASVAHGALIMAVFGICTIPTLLGFSFVINLLGLKFKNTMLTLSAIFIIAYGIYHAYLGFTATI